MAAVLRRSAQRALAGRHHYWRLADGSEVEILNILDDHSRVCIASVARRVSTGVQVWASFAAAFDRWGIPAEVLTDNAAVFTGKQRSQGRVALEVQLGLRGVRISHSGGVTWSV
jgi:transposase InsO family protein